MANALARRPAVTELDRLSGPEKAAVVLLALGEGHTKLWAQLNEEEIKEVGLAMAGLGTIASDVVEQLLMDFVSGMGHSGAVLGSYDQTERMLAAFMTPDKVEAMMDEIRGPAGRTMWGQAGQRE